MKKYISAIALLFFLGNYANAQEVLKLNDIFSLIQGDQPEIKVYDAQIRSLDEASKGAKSWAPPEFGAGFFMTPYNIGLTKAFTNEEGMGAFMISASQMFPNKKEQDASQQLMQSMSSVDKENKK